MSDEIGKGGIVWEQPPENLGGKSEFANNIRQIANRLKERPNQWARITPLLESTPANSKHIERYRMGFKTGFYRGINAGEYEFRRVTKNGIVAGWCRWLTPETRATVFPDVAK